MVSGLDKAKVAGSSAAAVKQNPNLMLFASKDLKYEVLH